jgi:SecD/SecF fusion protein
VSDLTNYSTNPIVIEALDKTDLAQRNSTKPYIEDFFTQFEELNREKGANLKLASPEVFGTQKLSSEIKFNTTDDQVKSIIRKKLMLL